MCIGKVKYYQKTQVFIVGQKNKSWALRTMSHSTALGKDDTNTSGWIKGIWSDGYDE